MIRRLSIVGLGLLGGSVAKAARAEGLAAEVVGVGRRRESLEPALRERVVDRITTDVAEGVAGSDFCVLAAPVATLKALLPAVWRALPADAVLTDAVEQRHAIGVGDGVAHAETGQACRLGEGAKHNGLAPLLHVRE